MPARFVQTVLPLIALIALLGAGPGWAQCCLRGETRLCPTAPTVACNYGQGTTFNPDGTCSLGSITLRGARGEVYRSTLAPATGRVRFYRGQREAGRGL